MDLAPRQRHLVVLTSVGRIALAWVLVLVAYALAPDRGISGVATFVKLGLDLLVVAGLLAWMTRRILVARFPVVAAAEALAIVSVIFVALFASLYLLLDDPAHPAFSQPLDHVKALYMTVTVLSTVGFGDIVARTNAARLFVTVQMVLDLILIGAVVRLLFSAAKHGLSQREG